MKEFKEKELNGLNCPKSDSGKGDNGRVTVIGGSKLFHGAPILALKTASRIVDMVFFASPDPSVGKVAERLRSQLSSFIWVPWDEIEDYLAKSEAVLIGPGLMRCHRDNKECQRQKICDDEGQKTKMLTEKLLRQFANKQWVIDAGALQTIAAESIPAKAILTPNKKELGMLFGEEGKEENLPSLTQKYDCIIAFKAPEMIVASPEEAVTVSGGNAGLTKGGTGDVLAGLTVALAAKNPPFLAACSASWITKKAADELYQKVGFTYNADDLAEEIPKVLGSYFR